MKRLLTISIFCSFLYLGLNAQNNPDTPHHELRTHLPMH